jgi:hypothetical protein
MSKPIFMKLGMYIMAPESISVMHFIKPSHQFVCLYVYPPVIARQWLSKNVTAAMNTRAKIEELLEVSFSMWSMSYQREVDNWFFSELIIIN